MHGKNSKSWWLITCNRPIYFKSLPSQSLTTGSPKNDGPRTKFGISYSFLVPCFRWTSYPWQTNGWNLQPSPMKRKEKDLNQTSMIMLCSMLIFRWTMLNFGKGKLFHEQMHPWCIPFNAFFALIIACRAPSSALGSRFEGPPYRKWHEVTLPKNKHGNGESSCSNIVQ